jgi:hypothetical protein
MNVIVKKRRSKMTAKKGMRGVSKTRGMGLQDEKLKPGKIMKAKSGKMMHKMPNGKMMKGAKHKGKK